MASTITSRFNAIGEIKFEVGAIKLDGKPVSRAVAEYLVAYGLKQSVDDAGADPARGVAAAQKRLAGYFAGEVPTGGFGARLDPAFRIARNAVALVAKIKKPATLKDWSAVEAAAKKAGIDPKKVRAYAAERAALETVNLDTLK